MISPQERRLSFTQMVRNAVLAARKDAAPQKAAPSGRVYRGMAWGFMQVDHPVRALFIRLVEWCAARVKQWHEQWLLPRRGRRPRIGTGRTRCVASLRQCCRGLGSRTGQAGTTANPRPPRVRRPWFDRTVLILIVANCVVMASKVSHRGGGGAR